MYSYLLANNKEDYRTKGLNRANIKKDLNHEIYKNCLFSSKMNLKVIQYNVASKNHEIGVYQNTKTSLTALD